MIKIMVYGVKNQSNFTIQLSNVINLQVSANQPSIMGVLPIQDQIQIMQEINHRVLDRANPLLDLLHHRFKYLENHKILRIKMIIEEEGMLFRNLKNIRLRRY